MVKEQRLAELLKNCEEAIAETASKLADKTSESLTQVEEDLDGRTSSKRSEGLPRGP